MNVKQKRKDEVKDKNQYKVESEYKSERDIEGIKAVDDLLEGKDPSMGSLHSSPAEAVRDVLEEEDAIVKIGRRSASQENEATYNLLVHFDEAPEGYEDEIGDGANYVVKVTESENGGVGEYKADDFNSSDYTTPGL